MSSPGTEKRIEQLLAGFKLPTLVQEFVPRLRQAGHENALPALLEIFELEAGDRRERRTARLLRAAHLPAGKTFATWHAQRLPAALQRQLTELARGDFLERATNVLAFGLPGTGKTHAACALGQALIEAGHAVFFTPAYQLVQELLRAKRDLVLPRALARLDVFELIIVDDIGYIQQNPEEADILFTLLAERYERRSLLITSNLVFSQWDQIFKNPIATAAAIDRVVHHSTILEFDVPSYRAEAAQGRAKTPPAPRSKS